MLVLYESNRVEHLVDALAELLSDPVGPPTVPEWIAVQSRGMETWLGMELCQRLGVWSAARVPFPRQLIEQLFEAVLGPPASDEVPFTGEHLLWAVLAALPAHLDRGPFSHLAAYLQDDPRGLKRLGLARRIATSLDQYAVYRPDLVIRWEAGDDGERADARWQADLHRACVRRLGATPMARRAAAFVQALAEDPAAADALPRRISLFGVSTLPPLYVQLLAAMAAHSDVHLFLPTPSVGAGEHNPLLTSMAGQAREFRSVLAGHAAPSAARDARFDPAPAPAPRPLLATLQADVIADRLRDPGARIPLADDDRSLQVHACHGPMREIEVLHDQLRDLLESDPTLSPADVIVMAPDVETYAPYVEAVFGSATARIPYRISDRQARSTAPAVQAFLGVLELVRGRVTAADVLDLLAYEPVARRHGIDAADLDVLQGWVRDAGIRWGIDASHRATFDQPARSRNTWRFGLDRLLLGYALSGERLFEGVLPHEAARGQGADLLGRFTGFCQILFEQLSALRDPRPLASWARDLEQLVDRLLDGNGDDAWQQQLIRVELQALAERGRLARFAEAVDLDVLRDVLATHFADTRSAHGFLAGGVTVCNLLPMRSIPFRVVCLVGLSDGDFPRTRRSPGFDLIEADPRPGDRSTRGDDRHQFLDALMSARDHLLITFVGQSIRDNAPLPPSVLVSELLDTVADTVQTGDDTHAWVRERLVLDHPLQPFSPRYFDGTARLFSYRAGLCQGARAVAGGRSEPRPFLTAPLPDDDLIAVLDVRDLLAFLRSPAAWFLERRIGVYPVRLDEALPDREPLQPGGLDDHRMATALLRHALAGGNLNDYRAVLEGRGELPLGTPGRCHHDDLVRRVRPLADAALAAMTGEPHEPRPVDLEVGGVRLTGRLTDLWPTGQRLATAGRIRPAAQLQLWLRHLLLCAMAPDLPQHSELLGRGAGVDVERLGYGPLQAEPRALIADLMALFAAGQREPLRFFPATSLAFADAVAAGEDTAEALRRSDEVWYARTIGGGREIPGEADDDAVARLFGDDDPRLDASGDVDPRFEQLALQVALPMLAHRVATGDTP